MFFFFFFFFSSRRRHTRLTCDWSSDVCSSDLRPGAIVCDATSPLATAVGRPAWQVVTPWEGSAAEQAKAILPSSVRMISGFHTISAEALHEFDRPLEGDVLLCGGDAEAKGTIGALVDR